MEGIAEILNRLNGLALTSDVADMTPQEREQMKVDGYNAEPGTLNEQDGYNCTICKNRGDIAVLNEYPAGCWGWKAVECKCMSTRASIRRMQQSGLKNIIKDYTLDKYKADEPWQKTIKDAAEAYVRDPKGWFFIGGQSGAGKTHICTAICREFLLNGRKVVYMLWRDDIAKLKSFAMEGEQRHEMIERFKRAEVLYVDDLFKTGKGKDGEKQQPSSADINAAFEIFNHRYNNPHLLTIISSESTADDILQIDEAVGGRIFEKAVVLNLAPDMSRNYRLRKAVTL